MSATGTLGAEMKPLGEVLNTSALPYPPTRCAGLNQALMEWVGEERMGTETYATMNRALPSLIAQAVIASRESSVAGSTEHLLDIVVRDVGNISQLYLSRFEANYAAEGEAFGSDDDLKNDMMLCKEIADTNLR